MVWMLGSRSPLTVMEWMCNGVDVGSRSPLTVKERLYNGVDVGVKVTIDSDGVDM